MADLAYLAAAAAGFGLCAVILRALTSTGTGEVTAK